MAFLYPWGNTQQLNLDWILQKIKELESSGGGGGGADLAEVANALISASYAVQAYDRSDIVFYDGKLYRANQAIPAPGESWTPAHWDEILLGDTVSNLVQYVAALSNDQIANSSTVSGTYTSDALDTLKTATETAVTNVKYDTGYLKKTINGADSNIIQIEDTPTDTSTKLPSSKAVYNANAAISNEATARANADTAIETGLAIVANGNVHYAILSGQFVYVKNHQTLSDGLYIATAIIPTNQPLTTNNTTPASTASGALNALQNESATGYCKMADGTAIIWGNVSGLSFSSESIKEGTITLPFALLSGNVHATPYNTSNQNYMFFCGASLQGGAGDTIAWTLATITGTAITITNRGFSWLAIGRWK